MQSLVPLLFRPLNAISFAWVLLLGWSSTKANDPIEHFEKHVRPILIEHCYECHNSFQTKEGGLALDWKQGLEAGGESGPAIVPGDVAASYLLKLVRHEVPGLEMPEGGEKLNDNAIKALEAWIRDGAIDPRVDKPVSEADVAQSTWEAKFNKRKTWWSFQPIVSTLPASIVSPSDTAPKSTIDLIIDNACEEKGLALAPPADAATVLRRLQFVLIGLPATTQQMNAFEAAYRLDPKQAVADRVDELLADQHFGERWARHWMDWVRYSEGHGGQGDPQIRSAFEYRDYLIRALNQDIPYDELVREHIAGDMLERPRIDTVHGINESIIGTAHFRFVEHGFFPVDALDELVKFTDNQVDVVSKAFLGLTVSCARCHDHKFDAISQRDYYALFGILASDRPALRPITARDEFDRRRSRLASEKERLASALKQQWLVETNREEIERRLEAWSKNRVRPNKEAIDKSKNKKPTVKEKGSELKPLASTELMYLWDQFRDSPHLTEQWGDQANRIRSTIAKARSNNEAVTVQSWDFRDSIPDGWNVYDGKAEIRGAGELGLGLDDETVLMSILPAGLVTHSATTLEGASIVSPDFTIPDGAVAFRWAGAGDATARLVPENFPRAGNLYKQSETSSSGQSHWFSRGSHFWRERRGYFHFMTFNCSTTSTPTVDDESKPAPVRKATRGSWLSLSEARLLKSDDSQVKPESYAAQSLLDEQAPTSRSELIACFASAIEKAVSRWRTDDFSDQDALFLSECLEAGLLAKNRDEMMPNVLESLNSLRAIEDEIPATDRSTPSALASVGFDQPLYVRGNIRSPAESVPRGFLSALDRSRPQITERSPDSPSRFTSSFHRELIDEPILAPKASSGTVNTSPTRSYSRLDLAYDITSSDNPLFSRVIANRLWQEVFGAGLVLTTDNFGATGDQPKLPVLLDHLAVKMREERWSVKSLLRYLLTSEAFRRSSRTSAESMTTDPSNRYWSRAVVRRLDAETFRDHLLALSGNLDTRLYGPSQSVSSKLDANNRRSVYLRIKRDKPDLILAAFDMPTPTTTRGTRDVTTTPAQAISLLNSPFVWHQAEVWSKRSLHDKPDESESQRIEELLRSAWTRQPKTDEVATCIRFLKELKGNMDPADAWKNLCHFVFNTKEFLYLP